jgi:hypothetical protein
MAIVDDLKQAHDEILDCIGSFSDDELDRCNTIGKWSARDVILHMTMWDGEVLKALAIWRTGHDYDWTYAEEYLKFNEFWHETLEKLTAKQVVQMFNLTRAALTADTSCVSDSIWKKRGEPTWLRGISIKHDGLHLKKLQEYQKSLGK